MYKYKLHWKRVLYMHTFTNLGFPTLFESSWHRKLNGSAIFHLSVDSMVSMEQRLASTALPIWTHYCKRSNVVPGPSQCFAHFSKDSFTQDPLRMAELGGHGKFQARLKPDAVPSIPLSQQRGERWPNHSTSDAKSFRKLAVMCPHFSEITVFREWKKTLSPFSYFALLLQPNAAQ
jgi:hypothetical protein